MPKLEFPFPMPNGWFCICRSDELKVGEVKSLKFCENEVVAFRTEKGNVSVLDAYCPHLGAHLGEGGCVHKETIECPFHAWRWNVDGSCAEIPYANNFPPKAKETIIKPYPCVELNGFIWAWHHLLGESPAFEVPKLDGFNNDDDKWGKVHTFEYKINTCLQEIAENDVDAAHFPKVHRSPSLPETDAFIDGIYKKTVAETLMDPNSDRVSEEYKNPDNEMFTTTFTRESWGLGIVFLRMTNIPPSGGEYVMVNASCPIDNRHSILRWSMRVSKDIQDDIGMAIIDGIAHGVLDDMPIWDNKSYVRNPILCDGDGPIHKFRKWVSQFYSEIPT